MTTHAHLRCGPGISLALALSWLLCACGGGAAVSVPAPPLDTTAPTVASVTPVGNSTGVPASASITASFSEAINCSAIAAGAMSVLDGATPVVGTTSCTGNVLSFSPAAVLPGNATLTVSIATSVADLARNRLAAAYTWQFGVKPWTVQAGTSGNDSASGVVVDAAGNVYVVGTTAGAFDGGASGGGSDAILIKYDKFGVRQWSRQFGSAADEAGYAVALDAAGNLFVAGTTTGNLANQPANTDTDAFVAKFDPNGTQLWLRQFHSEGTEMPRGIATDATGAVVVVGYTTGSLFSYYSIGGPDMFVLKLDASGTTLWSRQMGTSKTDNAAAVAIAASGDIYLTGYTYGALDSYMNAGSADFFVMKLDAAGTTQWTRQYGSSGLDVATGIAIDSGGNLYLSGRTEGAITGQPNAGGLDAFVARLDAGGSLLWIRQFGSSGDEYATQVAVDANGNALLTGFTSASLPGNSSAGADDMFLAKYDPSGNAVWVRQWGSAGVDQAWGLAVDAAGNSFVAGATEGAVDGNTHAGQSDLVLTKHSPNGVRR